MKRYYNIYKCITCDDGKEYSQSEIQKHLKEVHRIDPAKVKGTKEMVMHMDSRDWYASEYKIKIRNVELKNETCDKRSKESRAYWGG